MRAALLAVLLASAALAGCLSTQDTGSQAPGPEEPANGTPEDEGAEQEDAGDNASRLPAPDPPLDRRWTYEAQGAWNDLGRFDVVLAQTEDGSYLLAGAAPEDLDEEAVHDRPWHGPVDEELNPAEGTTFWDPLFDFPLHDGKTWAWDEGDTVHARATTVETPTGPAEGFEMELEGQENVEMRWTYAPGAAFLTSFTYEWRNTTVLDIQLVDVGSSQEWIWFEEGPEASTNADPEPDDPGITAFDVPEGYDAVVVAGGLEGGGEVRVHPPADSGEDAWTYAGEEAEQWAYDPLPAHEGSWTLEARQNPAASGDGGYAAVSARALTWVQPGSGQAG